jgi:hypothetical protein
MRGCPVHVAAAWALVFSCSMLAGLPRTAWTAASRGATAWGVGAASAGGGRTRLAFLGGVTRLQGTYEPRVRPPSVVTPSYRAPPPAPSNSRALPHPDHLIMAAVVDAAENIIDGRSRGRCFDSCVLPWPFEC